MIKKIIGGVITLIIGGTAFAVSQSDIVKNFSENTGMTQEQAQEYVNNISENDLDSFSSVGQSYIDDGNEMLSQASDIDCINYVYQWESSSLSCQTGKNQIQKMGNNEITLGNCYKALDTDLGDTARSKIGECISAIEKVISDYDLPIVTMFIDSKTITDTKNSNIYNKSVLEAALESK